MRLSQPAGCGIPRALSTVAIVGMHPYANVAVPLWSLRVLPTVARCRAGQASDWKAEKRQARALVCALSCPSKARRIVTERCGVAQRKAKRRERDHGVADADVLACNFVLPKRAKPTRATVLLVHERRNRPSRKGPSSLKPGLRHHPAPSLERSARHSSPKLPMSVGTLRTPRNGHRRARTRCANFFRLQWEGFGDAPVSDKLPILYVSTLSVFARMLPRSYIIPRHIGYFDVRASGCPAKARGIDPVRCLANVAIALVCTGCTG